MAPFMKVLHRIKGITNNRAMLLSGIVLAVIFWIVESLVTAAALGENEFVAQLFTPEIHEVWMRLMGMGIIIVFSFITQIILNRYKYTENQLKELSRHLDKTVNDRTTELAKVNSQLREQIDEKIEFTRVLVHELKTPLTPMIGASEILIDKVKNDEVLTRIAVNINRGAYNLNRRISDLSDLAKSEIGLLDVQYKPFDLLQMVYDLVDYVKINAERKLQSVTLDIPPSFPAVWADEDRIRQVILNLMDNAVKFTPQNGNILLKIDADQNSFMVHIKDNGYGIEEEDQKHLFELYWCSKNNKKGLSGLGMGLPLAKMLVELHGGQIWFRSEKGKGTTFSFSIPMMLSRLPSKKDQISVSSTQ